MARKKRSKKPRTPLEVAQSIRRPVAPPGHNHGDARKQQSRDGCRGKYREDE